MTTQTDCRQLPPTLGVDMFRFVPTLTEAEGMARRQGYDQFADQLAALIKLLTSNPIATNRKWELPDGWETVPRTLGMGKKTMQAVIDALAIRPQSGQFGQLWHPAGLCVTTEMFEKVVAVTNLDTGDRLATLFRSNLILNPPFWPKPCIQGACLAEWIPYVQAIGEMFTVASDEQMLAWELLDVMENNQIAATRSLEPPPCWWVVPSEIPLGPERLRHIEAMIRHLRDRDGITITFGVDDGHAYMDGSHFSVTPYRHVPVPMEEDEAAEYDQNMADFEAFQSRGEVPDEYEF